MSKRSNQPKVVQAFKKSPLLPNQRKTCRTAKAACLSSITGAKPRAHASHTAYTARSANLSKGAPDCLAPKNSPSPRISKSSWAILKPSFVSTMAFNRALAVSPTNAESPVEYSSTPADAAAPHFRRRPYLVERPGQSLCQQRRLAARLPPGNTGCGRAGTHRTHLQRTALFRPCADDGGLRVIALKHVICTCAFYAPIRTQLTAH